MPSYDFHRQRRSALLGSISEPVLLMAGGWSSRNYPANPYPYRADSNFLYFFARPEPDAAALFDPASHRVTLFLNERTPEDALWHGPVPSFADVAQAHGIDDVRPIASLEQSVRELVRGRPVRSLAIADARATARAARITGETLDFHSADHMGSAPLIDTLADLRIRKQPAEIDEMRATAAITDAAHRAAIAHTRAGDTEQTLAGVVEGVFARHGCVPAYNTILSVRGEVLHNHAHGNVLQPGDIVLLDAGAENAAGYCSDVTRCWPVSGKFEGEAAAIYDVVLAAEVAAIEAVRPGVRYRDLHMIAARHVASGLVELGLLRGSIDGLLETGAHALFFPHGVGHLIGLDVHDMEAFGDRVHYAPGRTRSEQFGTAYLRLDVDLAEGMTFTIEPGIYFVPAILQSSEFREKFGAQVDFAACERFLRMNDGRGFGGIRIEDDVLTTANGYEVLTAAIPKRRDQIEALVGTA